REIGDLDRKRERTLAPEREADELERYDERRGTRADVTEPERGGDDEQHREQREQHPVRLRRDREHPEEDDHAVADEGHLGDPLPPSKWIAPQARSSSPGRTSLRSRPSMITIFAPRSVLCVG